MSDEKVLTKEIAVSGFGVVQKRTCWSNGSDLKVIAGTGTDVEPPATLPNLNSGDNPPESGKPFAVWRNGKGEFLGWTYPPVVKSYQRKVNKQFYPGMMGRMRWGGGWTCGSQNAGSSGRTLMSLMIIEWPYNVVTDWENMTDLLPENEAVLLKHDPEVNCEVPDRLSDKTVEFMSKLSATLGLNDLTSLSDAQADSFSKHQGSLDLSGLTSLTDAAAKSLSKHGGELNLRGLGRHTDRTPEELSDAAAHHLVKHPNLNINLLNLPASAAKILRDAGLDYDSSPSLSEEPQ
jgi:hypothetical protein